MFLNLIPKTIIFKCDIIYNLRNCKILLDFHNLYTEKKEYFQSGIIFCIKFLMKILKSI